MSVSDDKTLIKRQYLEGVDIFKAGDQAHEAFIVEEGEVRIFKEKEGMQHEVAVMSNDDIFGEMALLRNGNHTSNAVATKRTTLIIVSEKAIKDKLKEADPLVAMLIHTFIKRLYLSNVERFGKDDIPEPQPEAEASPAEESEEAAE